MSTKRVFIEGGCKLEGILNENSKRGGVVICHPHPLYGGDMHNNVVNAIEEGFADQGFTTLRFNFRGVGASEGSYGEGQGEVEDLVGAVEFLKRPDRQRCGNHACRLLLWRMDMFNGSVQA